MATDLKTLANQGKNVWTKLPRQRKVILVGALVATIAAVALLSRKPEPKYALVFAGLSQEDAGEAVAALQAEGVPYRVEANGTAISVPQGKELDLRLRLAQKGVPSGGGVGFEIFDKQKFGTTSFVEQMNFKRALQGELARTIGSLDAVEAARVHLALGERSLYKKDDQPPSASVVLRLRGGRGLTPAQVQGIVNLVSSSVDGLRPDRVTVVDERGQVLSSDANAQDSGDQHDLERSLAQRIQEMLERIVGAGHVVVTVTSELDHSQVSTSEESFADKPVVRSESRTEEREPGSNTAGGLAGARGNLPGAPAAAVTVNDPGVMRVQQTANYEVSKVVKNTVGPKVRIARLHVAVLLDGVANDKGVKVARGAEELARIEALARDAAGLDTNRGDRITVQSSPFTVAEDESKAVAPPAAPFQLIPGLPWWLPFAGAGGLVLLITAVLLFRKKRKSDKVAQVLPALPVTVDQLERAMVPGSTEAAQLAGGPSFDRSSRERALEAARGDADRAAAVLSMWLTNDAAPAGGN
jgi:flagellar M-ring protein FliF